MVIDPFIHLGNKLIWCMLTEPQNPSLTVNEPQALNTNSVHETDAEVPRPQVHETDNVEDNVVHDSLFTSLSGDLDGKDVANTYQKMEFLGQDIIDQLMN
eukprot:369319_1